MSLISEDHKLNVFMIISPWFYFKAEYISILAKILDIGRDITRGFVCATTLVL